MVKYLSFSMVIMIGIMTLLVSGCQPNSKIKVKVAGLADKSVEKDNATPDDVIAPTIISVTSATADQKYTTVGDIITIDVVFSEIVGVTHESDITLDLALGTTEARHATYASGSGGTTLTFAYAVQAEDFTDDLQYAGVDALKLSPNGTITDANLNDAILVLPDLSAATSLASQKNIAIDARTAAAELFDTLISFERKYYQTTSIKRLILNTEQVEIEDGPSLAIKLDGQNMTCSVTKPYSSPVIPVANAMAGLVFDDQNAINAMLSGIEYGKETEIKIKYMVGNDLRSNSKDKITIQDFYIADLSITGFEDGSLEKDGFIGWLSPMHAEAPGINTSFDASHTSSLTTNFDDILLQ